MSDINEEFEELASKINRKLKEAVAALKEVNRLKEKANLPALICSIWSTEDMEEDERDSFESKLELIDVSELENELDEAGWSTSSSYC